jgi:hypothetical protein
MTSLANTKLNDSASVVQPQTVTQKGPVLVKTRIPKPKLFRSNPHRKTHFLLIDDNDDVFVQDEDLATGYRRRDLTKIDHEDGISEYIQWRLFLARQMALLKYREKWA